MAFFKQKFEVLPNNEGYFYKSNKFQKKLEPGVYYFFDKKGLISLYNIPTVSKSKTFTNQEVLTKDNIALRFSYYVRYKIEDGEKYLEKLDFVTYQFSFLQSAEDLIHNLSQLKIREQISTHLSEELNEKRNELFKDILTTINNELKEYGIILDDISVLDITFPKIIQQLFAKVLEAKIRSKADLENARTQVAAARALKNASDMMKNDENIKFLNYLETITKIASKGNHTFIIGDYKGLPPQK